MRKLLFLGSAQRFADFTLLLLRLFIGLFLVWAVWDQVSSSEHLHQYAQFLGKHHFPSPALLAPVSAYLQLCIGAGFILGLLTRWAGLLCAIHFCIAIAMVDHSGGMRGIFPSGCLVVIGLFLGTYGAGRLSLDAALRANDVPRSAGSVRLKK